MGDMDGRSSGQGQRVRTGRGRVLQGVVVGLEILPSRNILGDIDSNLA